MIGHKSAVIQMKLLQRMRMISMDKGGDIIIWDLRTSKPIQRFSKRNDEVTCFVVSEDERFLFVGTKPGHVSLYEIEKGEELKRSFLKEETKVTSLSLLGGENRLVVGTKSGRLSFYSLLPDETSLLQQLKNREYYDCLLYTSPSPRDG